MFYYSTIQFWENYLLLIQFDRYESRLSMCIVCMKCMKNRVIVCIKRFLTSVRENSSWVKNRDSSFIMKLFGIKYGRHGVISLNRIRLFRLNATTWLVFKSNFPSSNVSCSNNIPKPYCVQTALCSFNKIHFSSCNMPNGALENQKILPNHCKIIQTIYEISNWPHSRKDPCFCFS